MPFLYLILMLQLSYGRHVGIRPLIWAHVVIATKGSARSTKCKSILLKYFAFTSFACTERFMKREKSPCLFLLFDSKIEN